MTLTSCVLCGSVDAGTYGTNSGSTNMTVSARVSSPGSSVFLDAAFPYTTTKERTPEFTTVSIILLC